MQVRAECHESIEKNPYKALQCLKILTEAVSIAMNLSLISGHSTYLYDSNQTQELSDYSISPLYLKMQKNLETIVNLLKNYQICIPLHQIPNENPLTIGVKILEEVQCPDLISLQIEKNLSKYCTEKRQNMDTILAVFLKKKAKKTAQEGLRAWESAIVKSIQYIQNTEIRAKISLAVLDSAQIPLSKDYNSLLESCLSYKSKCEDYFNSIYTLQKFKYISMLYTNEEISVNDKYQVFRLMTVILNSDKANSIADAFVVLNMLPGFKRSQIYVHFLSGCIEFSEVERVDRMFGHLKEEIEMENILDGLVAFCFRLLDDSGPNAKWFKDRYIRVCRAGIRLIRLFLGCNLGLELEKFGNFLELAEKYDIFITSLEYSQKAKKKAILLSYIPQYLAQIQQVHSKPYQHLESFSQSPHISLNFLQNLSKLLQVPSHKFYLDLALESSNFPDLSTNTLSLLSNLTSHPLKSHEITLLIQIATTLIQAVPDNSIPSKLIQIFTSVFLSCPKIDNSRINKVLKNLEICENIYSQTSGIFIENQQFPDTLTENISISFTEIRPYIIRFFKDRCDGGNKYTRELIDKLLSKQQGLRTALDILTSSPIEILREGELDSINCALFENLTKSRHINHEQALMLLMEIKDTEVLNKLSIGINKKLPNFETIQTICSIGKDCAVLNKQEKVLENWKDTEEVARCNSRLRELGIKTDISEVAIEDIDDVMNLIEEVMRKQGSLEFCNEIAKAFEVSETEVLKRYIMNLIIFPEFTSETLALLKNFPEKLEVFLQKNYPFSKSYMQKVKDLIPKLKKNEKKILCAKCISKITLVDYPRVKFVYEITGFNEQNRKMLKIIEFFEDYQRNCEPSKDELKTTIDTNPYLLKDMKNVYQIMAKYKISLNLLFESIEPVIKQEINLKNLYQFQKLKEFTEVTTDKMVVFALKKEFSHEHNGKVCSLCPSVSKAIEEVLEMTEITEKINILHWMSLFYQYSPDCIKLRNEQIGIIKQQLAIARCKDLENTLEECRNQKKYQRIMLELYENGIEEDFSQVFDKPFRLITEIYYTLIGKTHEKLLEITENSLAELISKLCKICKINNQEINERIFEKLLSENEKISDETIKNTTAYSFNRAEYLRTPTNAILQLLAQSIDPLHITSFLISIIKNEKFEETSGLTLAKSLTLLNKINKSELKKLNFPCEYLYYIELAWYQADFELLKIPFKISSFINSDKEKFCIGIYKMYGNEIRTLQVISCIMVYHSILNTELYKNILTGLLGLGDFYAALLLMWRIIISGVYEKAFSNDLSSFFAKTFQNIALRMCEAKDPSHLPLLYKACEELKVPYKDIGEIIRELVKVPCRDFAIFAVKFAETIGAKAIAGVFAYYFPLEIDWFLEVLRSEKTLDYNFMNTEELFQSFQKQPILFKEFLNRLPPDQVLQKKIHN